MDIRKDRVTRSPFFVRFFFFFSILPDPNIASWIFPVFRRISSDLEVQQLLQTPEKKIGILIF